MKIALPGVGHLGHTLRQRPRGAHHFDEACQSD